MAAVFEAEERIKSVTIEGVALLKIVKHCHESLPQMVTGSLLGLVVKEGVLEITHAFPFPEPLPRGGGGAAGGVVEYKDEPTDDAMDDVGALEGHEFQLEMMRMLREVNVDNNCVGWYQSMYLGSYSTSSFLENQLSYQTDLSPNAVVLLYDPMQTTRGTMMLKCYRLTDAAVALQQSNSNAFMDPKDIFESIPVELHNPGLVKALLNDMMEDGSPYSYEGMSPMTTLNLDRLDLSTNPYLEKHLEFLCSWVDDLVTEQAKFQYYARTLQRSRRPKDKAGAASSSKADNKWLSSDAPSRMESLLINNQITTYCDQMDQFANGGFGTLFLAGALHKEKRATAATSQTR